jgi:predicted O-methyltransferase YrrM
MVELDMTGDALLGETSVTRSRSPRPKTPEDIPGWFRPVDRDLFRMVLAWQVANQPPGDLVELGCYMGKSAVVIGESLQTTETFTVCDLFGGETPDADNASENQGSYNLLNREEFERNYLLFRQPLPVVLAMSTADILDYVEPHSARFIHVDASHLYEQVAVDIASAKIMLRPDGVVVFDDYRSAHAPGVGAAVWRAMMMDGLVPIAVTPKKWYGTWGDPRAVRRSIREWAKADPTKRVSGPVIDGHRVLRIAEPRRRLPGGFAPRRGSGRR